MRRRYAKGMGIGLLACAILSGCGDSPSTQDESTAVFRSQTASHLSPGLLSDETDDDTVSIEKDAMAPTQKSVLQHIYGEEDLTRFSSALKEAGMESSLNGTGPYTLFVPSDSAFEAMIGDSAFKALMEPENKERLRQLLSCHFVTGKLAITDLKEGTTLKTAGGQQLNVTKQKGEVRINGAALKTTDDGNSNGVVHVVNKVLTPPS